MSEPLLFTHIQTRSLKVFIGGLEPSFVSSALRPLKKDPETHQKHTQRSHKEGNEAHEEVLRCHLPEYTQDTEDTWGFGGGVSVVRMAKDQSY